MVDATTFRDAMSRLAAAVSIVTSDGPGGLSGCTASAVCSVSDEPAILLVCINRTSRNNAVFKQNGRLCVNVLRAEQRELAAIFARSAGSAPAAARFADGEWSIKTAASLGAAAMTQTPTSPVLAAALVSLDCGIVEIAEIGSHTVFYCQVEKAHFGEPGPALLYYQREFQALPHPPTRITEHPHPG